MTNRSNSDIIYSKNHYSQNFKSSKVIYFADYTNAGHCFPEEPERMCWYLAGGVSEEASHKAAGVPISATYRESSQEIQSALPVWVYPQLTSAYGTEVKV